MKLTKLQRHTAYILVLAEIEEYNYSSGLCLLICEMFCDSTDGYDNWVLESPFYVYDLKTFEAAFPELYKFKNGSKNDYWFRTWGERKAAVEQCIKETA